MGKALPKTIVLQCKSPVISTPHSLESQSAALIRLSGAFGPFDWNRKLTPLDIRWNVANERGEHIVFGWFPGRFFRGSSWFETLLHPSRVPHLSADLWWWIPYPCTHDCTYVGNIVAFRLDHREGDGTKFDSNRNKRGSVSVVYFLPPFLSRLWRLR